MCTYYRYPKKRTPTWLAHLFDTTALLLCHFYGFQKRILACFRGWDLLASVEKHNFLDDDYHDGNGLIGDNDVDFGDGDDMDDDDYAHKSWPSLQRPN